MSLPARRIAPKNDTTGTGAGSTSQALALTTLLTEYQPGDLVVVQVESADDPPAVTLDLISTGNATITTEDASRSTTGTTTITLKDGTSGSVNYDDRTASTTAGLYIYTWSFLVTAATTPSAGVTTGLTAHATFTASGARRLSVCVDKPGGSDSWPTRATRTIAVAKNTDTNTGAATYWGTEGSFTDTGPMVAHYAWAKGNSTGTVTIDTDGPGSGAGTADPANDGTYSGTTVYLDASGRGFADAFWAGGGTTHPKSAGHTGFIHSANPTGTKAQVIVIYGLVTPPPPVAGNSRIEHDTPHAGTSHAGPLTGAATLEHDTPRAGTSEVGVQIFGSAAHEADIARQSPTETTISGEWLIAQPSSATFVPSSLKANVSKITGDDPADIKIGLREGGTTINESAWTALTDTPTALVVPITNPITTPSDLRLHVDVRKLSDLSVRPVLNRAEFDVAYFALEHDTPRAGTVNPPPVHGSATSEHDKAASGAANAPAVVGRATSEHDHPIHGQSTTPVQGRATSERDQVAHGILGGQIGVEHDHPIGGHVLGGNPQGNSRVEHDTPHAGTVAGSPIHGSATVEHDTPHAAAVEDIDIRFGKQRDGWIFGKQRDGWIFT